jgi:hypothetical protein
MTEGLGLLVQRNTWIPACYFPLSLSVMVSDRRECSNLIVLYGIAINNKKYYNKQSYNNNHQRI